MEQRRIVIVGSGFAGVWAALGAAARRRRERAEDTLRITLISPDGALVMRPRLYEADLDGVRVPLEGILRPIGVELCIGSVEGIDSRRRGLTLAGQAPGGMTYDQLVLCAGSTLRVPQHVGRIHSVDSHAEAGALHAAIAALRERPQAGYRATVVGAGFTGVEVAAELTAMLAGAARAAGAEPARDPVHLIESGSSIAPEFGPAARTVIGDALTDLGVRFHTETSVSRVDDRGVLLADGERIESDLTVWACGPRASALNEQLGVALDECGRAAVDRYLAAGVDGVWVAGDCARAAADGRQIAPMSCQHAMPQGRLAGENAVASALGRALASYRQPLYLTCLDLGSGGALLTSGFARERIIATGPQGKEFKRFINRSLIYPPPGQEASPLLELGRTAPPGPFIARIQALALRSAATRKRLTSRAEDRATAYFKAETA
jgi:NADH dehydrogenase